MQHRRVIALYAGLWFGSQLSAGCGASRQDDLDIAKIRERLQVASGTFAPGTEAAVYNRYLHQAGLLVAINFAGSNEGSLSTTQQIVAGVVSAWPANAWCPALATLTTGTCACPEGGQLIFDTTAARRTPQADGTVLSAYTFNNERCTWKGVTLDGTELYHRVDQNTPNSTPDIVAALHMSQSAPEMRYDVESINRPDTLVNVAVDDGQLIASGIDLNTNKVTFTDREQSYRCSVTSGQGTCIGDDGSTRTFRP